MKGSLRDIVLPLWGGAVGSAIFLAAISEIETVGRTVGSVIGVVGLVGLIVYWFACAANSNIKW